MMLEQQVAELNRLLNEYLLYIPIKTTKYHEFQEFKNLKSWEMGFNAKTCKISGIKNKRQGFYSLDGLILQVTYK
jgi:hypothetical protein